ncbi:MAG: hypothetical protein HC927_13645 [Deltaproteobacteria bacterium]|nr:hypothetical protein [Deltaproteobacteria bacterium]
MAESTDESNDNKAPGHSQAHADDQGDQRDSDDHGTAEELAEAAQSMFREYADNLRDFGRRVVAMARRNPIPASLVAIAAGYLVGRMVRRAT